MQHAPEAGLPPATPPRVPAPLRKEPRLVSERPTHILFITGLILYLLFAFFDLSKPGMEYDECFFFAKAMTDLQNRTIPVVLNCYLGALKEIIWIPIALLLHPSECSLRAPSVLIGLLSLLTFYAFLRKAFGNNIARLASLFLCIDPNFIFQVKYDTAPLSLSMLLRVALLYTSFLFHKTRSRSYLYLSFLIFGLGLYNKVTYLNFLAIILLPYVLAYFKDVRSLARETSMSSLRVILTSALCFSAGACPLLYVNLFASPLCTIKQILNRSGDFEAKTSLTWTEKTTYKTGLMINSLSGDLFLQEIVSGATIYTPEYFDRFTYSYDHEPKRPAFVRGLNIFNGNGLPFLTLFAFVSSLVLYMSRRRRIYLYVFTSMLVWYLSSVVLSGVVYSFHILTIYPMLIVYIVLILADVAQTIGRQAVRKLFLCGVLAIYVVSDIGQDITYAYSIHVGDSKGMWSKAINELSSVMLAKYEDRTIYVLDWGIRPQLVILCGNRLRLRGGLDGTERTRLKQIIEEDNSIFLMHTPKYSKFIKRRKEFFGWIEERQLKIDLLSEIRQENGEVLFEIYGRK
jgi:hypothetical protein